MNLGKYIEKIRASLGRFLKPITVIVVLVGISMGYYLSLPSVRQVEQLKNEGNTAALTQLISENTESDRFLDVIEAAVNSLLEIDDQESISMLGNIVADSKKPLSVRKAIIERFVAHQRIFPNLFEMITSNLDLKPDLIAATNRVEPTLFDGKVKRELEKAEELLQTNFDGALECVPRIYAYDVNQSHQNEIGNFQYKALIFKLSQSPFESAQNILDDVAKIEVSSTKEEDNERLRELSEVVENLRESKRNLDQAKYKLSSLHAESARLSSSIETIQQYLENAFIYAYIIGQYSPNEYEISFNLYNHNRGVLRTKETTFTSKGWFRMYVKSLGMKSVSLQSGGYAQWPYFEEDPDAARKEQELASLLILYDANRTEIHKAESIQNQYQQQVNNNMSRFQAMMDELRANFQMAKVSQKSSEEMNQEI